MRMHFLGLIGHPRWDAGWLAACIAGFLLLNAAAVAIPWKLGLRTIERYEV